MPVSPVPADSDAPDLFAPAAALLHDLLAVSLTPVHLLRPHYGPGNGPDLVDFAIEYLNPAAQRLSGLGERPGGTISTHFPQLFANGVFEFYRRVFETGAPEYYDADFQGEDSVTGSRVAARRSGALLLVSFGGPGTQDPGPVATALRASQAREQAHAAALQESEARFRTMMEQTPIPLTVTRGPAVVIESINAAMLHLMGLAPDAPVLGRAMTQVLPELEAQAILRAARGVTATGEPFHGSEVPVLLRPGTGLALEQRYYNESYTPLRAAGQEPGVLHVALDVTDQVRARQRLEVVAAALQASESSFRTIADAAPAMLWVTDPDGQCTYLNAQWYLFTGQTEAEALGLGWTNAVHPDDAETAGRLFLDANARRVLFHIRYRLRRHDGVYRWATDTGWPRFTDTGAYAGIVGTVIDVHEQQLAEDELLATNQQLRRTNVDLDNFIYTASHDLKAPISNIEGLLLALEHELPPAGRVGDVPLMLTLMQGATERFKRTIAHLTDISRLQKEHAQPSQSVGLAAVIEEVRLDLLPLLQNTQAQLRVQVPADLTLTFSEKNLRSVVYNLLSNALKYRHPDRPPLVHLRTRPEGRYQVLEVEDNGLGLDLAQGQEKLFAMFQRLHTHVEGSGIGLYMVKKMVENAGGRIEVESQFGQGSTFRVYILA